jgi:hypothetical protein
VTDHGERPRPNWLIPNQLIARQLIPNQLIARQLIPR